MKRLFVCACLVFWSVPVSRAEGQFPTPLVDAGRAGPDFSATSAAKVALFDPLAIDPFWQPAPISVSVPSGPLPIAALPAEPVSADPASPSPKPKFLYGGRNDYRWQLGLEFTWFRFQSSIFDANTIGVKTAVSYFLNDWFGVEGSVSASFSPSTISGFQNERAKFVVYGGGPKIAWRQKRWEPWAHAIFGGAHEQPQTADNSRNSYAIQAGGGADYRWNPRVSFRFEGNYVLTGFFQQKQNNVQLAAGIVFHF